MYIWNMQCSRSMQPTGIKHDRRGSVKKAKARRSNRARSGRLDGLAPPSSSGDTVCRNLLTSKVETKLNMMPEGMFSQPQHSDNVRRLTPAMLLILENTTAISHLLRAPEGRFKRFQELCLDQVPCAILVDTATDGEQAQQL